MSSDSTPCVIKFDKVSKQYGLPIRQALKRLVGRSGTRSSALEDISFDVSAGETIGIIGSNGSGKTTLLRLLAGVTPPTSGSVRVNGRVFPMLELTAGAHSELTGRENARLLLALAVMSDESEDQLESIGSYSGLGSWFDEPIRKYSSGMLARLGFSVAAHVNAQIVLIDEVLAVGDLSFQRQCIATVERWKKDGKTVLFVSHNVRQIERVCDRTLWLEQGKLRALGETAAIVAQYTSETNSALAGVLGKVKTDATHQIEQDIEEPAVIVTAVRFVQTSGEELRTIRTNDQLNVRISFDGLESASGSASVSLSIITIDGIEVAAFDSGQYGFMVDIQGKNEVTCVISRLPLMPGLYYLEVRVVSEWGQVFGRARVTAPLEVEIPEFMKISAHTGLVHLDATWTA